MDYTKCVGFADCPCRKCRDTRRETREQHPNHGHPSDRSYCLACTAADRDAHLVEGR